MVDHWWGKISFGHMARHGASCCVMSTEIIRKYTSVKRSSWDFTFYVETVAVFEVTYIFIRRRLILIRGEKTIKVFCDCVLAKII